MLIIVQCIYSLHAEDTSCWNGALIRGRIYKTCCEHKQYVEYQAVWIAANKHLCWSLFTGKEKHGILQIWQFCLFIPVYFDWNMKEMSQQSDFLYVALINDTNFPHNVSKIWQLNGNIIHTTVKCMAFTVFSMIIECFGFSYSLNNLNMLNWNTLIVNYDNTMCYVCWYMYF